MIMPSSVSVTSAPMAFKLSTMMAMRLDSLTFSSAASFMTVSPWAVQAMAAIMGSSSIRVGITSPSTTVPLRGEWRTRRSAVGSAPLWFSFNSVRSAPMSRQTFRIPARVGLIPTPLISTWEPGTIRAPAMK